MSEEIKEKKNGISWDALILGLVLLVQEQFP
jgi:hypothetical protein